MECFHIDESGYTGFDLLNADIQAGRRRPCREGLARIMLANVGLAVNLDEDIEGEVAR